MAYKISEVILPDTVELDHENFQSKEDLFTHMVSLLYRAKRITSEDSFMESLYEREDLGPTYMGNFIAIPHGKSEAVKESTIAFCRCSQGLLYNSHGEEGIVKIIFMLAIPKETSAEKYIKVLSTLSRLLTYEDFITKLEKAENYEDVIKAVKSTEKLLDQ